MGDAPHADDPLAAPLQLPCGVQLTNRLAKAAMSEQLGDRRNAPTTRLATLYRAWATGGAGLVITGNVMVDRSALGEPGNVVVEDERDMELLRAWAAAADGTDCSVWMQLNHPGRQSPRFLSPHPVAPSPVPMRSGRAAFAPPRQLRSDEIVDVIDRFANAARVAQRAGFAGVQVHGAHGYLVSQFLSPHTNRRDDEWGGDLSRRMRFLLDVVGAIRAVVGPEFPVGVKLNSADFQRGGLEEEDSVRVVGALQDAGIDLLEVSGGTYERAVMVGAARPRGSERASTSSREAYFIDYARRVRAVCDVPLMLTGGFRSGEAMRAAVSIGDVDVVGLARPFSVAPDLPRELLDGTVDRSFVRPIGTGIRRLDGLAEIAWHTQQLHRLSAGRAPAPRRSVARALGQALVTNGTTALRRVRG